MSVNGSVNLCNGCLMRVALIVFALAPLFLHAQQVDVKVNGGFLSDSLKIGENTAYYLSARYPADLVVLFPDSTHGFSPFEYASKEYFLTRTTNGVSVDSAVYYLTTFEIDRVQYLSLPVYISHGADCTTVNTQRDSVLVTQFVAHVPDTVAAPQLPLKANATYEKVSYTFNVWAAVIIVSVVVIAAVVIWAVFGKRIGRYFLRRKLKKNHASFVERFNSLLSQLKTGFSPPMAESALFTWKKYMEQLESKPYTKLTTKETVRIVGEPALTNDLNQIDRAIYGHNTAVVDSLQNLKVFADRQFQRRMKEVEHG